jgi:ABC-type molybdate transport system substrate-binding protein
VARVREWAFGVLACVIFLSLSGSGHAEDSEQQAQKNGQAFAAEIFPPWQGGQNNDATDRGLEFTAPEVDNLADFHGDPISPKLVLYVGGNYFFAMAPLVAEFERENPQLKGKIYWETLPPGLLAQQLQRGGAVTSGNMSWTVKADAFFAGLKKVRSMVDDGALVAPVVPYVTNTLAIMVPAGNPGHVKGLADLAEPGLRLAMPNPEFEGIAKQIEASLRKAGGEPLAEAIYRTKVSNGSAVLTQIHHRQTPLFLMQARADAGVTWKSEALFQEQIGHPITHVDIPDEQNVTAIYAGAVVKGAEHPEAAQSWLAYIHSEPALAIFARYGFRAYRGEDPAR